MTTTYGWTQKAQDETLCKTQNRFSIRWSGRGTVLAGTSTMRLLRENLSQAFYLPEQTVIYARLHVITCNVTSAYVNADNTATDTIDHIAGDYCIYRDLSGNVTVGIDPATPATEGKVTVVPVANTTVQGFEMLVTELDTASASMIVFAEMDCFCIHEGSALAKFPAGKTAALTVAG